MHDQPENYYVVIFLLRAFVITGIGVHRATVDPKTARGRIDSQIFLGRRLLSTAAR